MLTVITDISLTPGFNAGQQLKKIIVENYKAFEGELKVRVRVVPENVGNHIALTLESQCGEKVVNETARIICKGEIICEIICKGATVKEFENFSLKIELDREVCDLNVPKITIEVSVFGQSDSTLSITVGKIH